MVLNQIGSLRYEFQRCWDTLSMNQNGCIGKNIRSHDFAELQNVPTSEGRSGGTNLCRKKNKVIFGNFRVSTFEWCR